MIKYSIQKKKKGYYFVYHHPETKKQTWKTLSTTDLSTAKIKAGQLLHQIESEFSGIRLSEMKQLWIKYNLKKSEWYKKDVEKHFQPFVEFFKDSSGDSLTIKHLYDYQSHLESKKSKRTKKPISKTTISIAFGTIKSVWNFNRKLGKVTNDIFLNFKLPKRNEKKEWLTVEQLKKVIEKAVEYPLYQGFIELLIITGMRIGELSKLKWSNINDTHIVLENTKRGENDVIKMREEIRESIDKIKKNQKLHKIYVFSSVDGKRLSYDTCSRMVKRFLIEAGFPNHTPHSLRHSFATNLILKGVDIYRVKELMRHNNVTTTQRYIKFTGMDISEVEARIIPKDEEPIKYIEVDSKWKVGKVTVKKLKKI